MERNETMGRVTAEIEVANDRDLGLVAAGALSPEKARRVTITALVDTGATTLALPEDVIQRLGLQPLRQVRARLADGQIMSRTLYGSARLTVMKRAVTVDVLSVPTNAPALLGQIPLEGLDFVVDPRNQRLIPNPESPDPEFAVVDLY